MPGLLLINPGHLASPAWGWRAYPTHLHHMWSALVDHGAVDVADYNLLFGAPTAQNRDEYLGKIREDLSKRDFDIAGISCWSSLNVTASYAVARIIREIRPGVRIYVGGYHPTALPGDFGPELFDVVVRGCGIGPLRLALGGKREDSGHSVVQGSAPVIVRPRWEGFGYRAPGGVVALYLSRGCPFRCSFCMESIMGRKWIALDPGIAADAVVEAIRTTGTPYLQVHDPLFGLKRKWRGAFLDALVARRRKFDNKTFIWAQVRSDTLTPEDIKKLRRFRFQLAFGLESASGLILRIMNKTRQPDIYLRRFAELSDLLDKKKIHHQAFFIFNHPGETPETLDEARGWILKMLEKKRKSYLTVMGQQYVHFPGSPLEEKMAELNRTYGTKALHPGWWLDDDDHHKKASAVIPSKALEQSGQIERWKDVMNEVMTLNLEISSKTNRPDVESFRDQFNALISNSS